MNIEDQLSAPIGAEFDTADYKSEAIEDRIAELKNKLDSKCKDFPILLKKIHHQVQSTPELLHILQDDQIAVIVQGLMAHTRTEIAAKISPKQKKALLNTAVSLDDL